MLKIGLVWFEVLWGYCIIKKNYIVIKKVFDFLHY